MDRVTQREEGLSRHQEMVDVEDVGIVDDW